VFNNNKSILNIKCDVGLVTFPNGGSIMARDKSKDDKYFNCSQEHERKYVASLYQDEAGVNKFLIKKCQDGTIHYWTHMKVYELIKKDLGYPIPV
jgi:hypothetical protein